MGRPLEPIPIAYGHKLNQNKYSVNCRALWEHLWSLPCSRVAPQCFEGVLTPPTTTRGPSMFLSVLGLEVPVSPLLNELPPPLKQYLQYWDSPILKDGHRGGKKVLISLVVALKWWSYVAVWHRFNDSHCHGLVTKDNLRWGSDLGLPSQSVTAATAFV